MTAVKKDLYIEQGATFGLSFVWSDGTEAASPGDPVDLTGAVARMQFRKSQAQAALLSASSDGSSPRITLGGSDGTISILLTDADTDSLTSKLLMYDLEVELADGTVVRLLQGKVTVDPNITQLPGDPVVEG
jgi:hypothetical protein